ncbi:hypothetical protein H4Q26_012371 [Puccinia striiformis f. sp. tritici PST-130]|nr:hypothetical protein H4Q26_012371 [Puccinia striiformis f. sp. tritici PST-130]
MLGVNLGGWLVLEPSLIQYFLKAITWARKYGLRIILDLHAGPGSQNGWNHSGKLGTLASYVFISQSQYNMSSQCFSVLNEAQTGIIGAGAMRSLYYQVYQMLQILEVQGQVTAHSWPSTKAAQGVTYAPKIVLGDLDTWQVGGQGAGQILASKVQKYSQFPLDVIGGGPGGLNYPAASLHRYIAAGNPVTLVPSPPANGTNHIWLD